MDESIIVENTNSFIDTIDKIDINEGDLILIRVPDGSSPEKIFMRNISDHIKNRGGFIIFANENITIEKFDETQMEKLGWVRKEKVRSFI